MHSKLVQHLRPAMVAEAATKRSDVYHKFLYAALVFGRTLRNHTRGLESYILPGAIRKNCPRVARPNSATFAPKLGRLPPNLEPPIGQDWPNLAGRPLDVAPKRSVEEIASAFAAIPGRLFRGAWGSEQSPSNIQEFRGESSPPPSPSPGVSQTPGARQRRTITTFGGRTTFGNDLAGQPYWAL